MTDISHQSPPCPNDVYSYRAEVVGVHDGDSVHLNWDFGRGIWELDTLFRLWGINAPELYGDSAEAGEAARRHLMFLITQVDGVEIVSEHPVVMIRTHKRRRGTFARDKHGKYGRYLVELWGEDWENTGHFTRNINQLMIDDGHAEPYEE